MTSILFYLTPKKDVGFIDNTSTIRQAIEKMEFHHYLAVPILSETGEYLGVISTADLLFYIKNEKLDMKLIESELVSNVPLERDVKSVKIDATPDDVMSLMAKQNFVPVVDDRNMFIGIITRRSIMSSLSKEDIEKIFDNDDNISE
ncbi:MAG: CBS domain-containing protein [Coprobacillus sp.]|nr:CBS domain-containing protein [Coprobacillus sp.]